MSDVKSDIISTDIGPVSAGQIRNISLTNWVNPAYMQTIHNRMGSDVCVPRCFRLLHVEGRQTGRFEKCSSGYSMHGHRSVTADD